MNIFVRLRFELTKFIDTFFITTKLLSNWKITDVHEFSTPQFLEVRMPSCSSSLLSQQVYSHDLLSHLVTLPLYLALLTAVRTILTNSPQLNSRAVRCLVVMPSGSFSETLDFPKPFRELRTIRNFLFVSRKREQ